MHKSWNLWDANHTAYSGFIYLYLKKGIEYIT
jgi:hypothetical protein